MRDVAKIVIGVLIALAIVIAVALVVNLLTHSGTTHGAGVAPAPSQDPFVGTWQATAYGPGSGVTTPVLARCAGKTTSQKKGT